MIPRMKWTRLLASAVILALVVCVGCRSVEAPGGSAGTPNTQDVTKFLSDANATLLKLSNAANEAGWVQDTYITVDTQAISARANEALVNALTDYAKRAARFPADAGSAGIKDGRSAGSKQLDRDRPSHNLDDSAVGILHMETELDVVRGCQTVRLEHLRHRVAVEPFDADGEVIDEPWRVLLPERHQRGIHPGSSSA